MMTASLACCCRPGLIGARAILFMRTAGWPCAFFWVVPAAGRQSLGPQEPASGRPYPGRYRIGSRSTGRRWGPSGHAGYRIGTNTASRRYSAGNCLPSAASLGAS